MWASPLLRANGPDTRFKTGSSRVDGNAALALTEARHMRRTLSRIAALVLLVSGIFAVEAHSKAYVAIGKALGKAIQTISRLHDDIAYMESALTDVANNKALKPKSPTWASFVDDAKKLAAEIDGLNPESVTIDFDHKREQARLSDCAQYQDAYAKIKAFHQDMKDTIAALKEIGGELSGASDKLLKADAGAASLVKLYAQLSSNPAPGLAQFFAFQAYDIEVHARKAMAGVRNSIEAKKKRIDDRRVRAEAGAKDWDVTMQKLESWYPQKKKSCGH